MKPSDKEFLEKRNKEMWGVKPSEVLKARIIPNLPLDCRDEVREIINQFFKEYKVVEK